LSAKQPPTRKKQLTKRRGTANQINPSGSFKPLFSASDSFILAKNQNVKKKKHLSTSNDHKALQIKAQRPFGVNNC
jgi:hypothetical protein